MVNNNRIIRCGRQTLTLSNPLVMGILNCTEDSFYAASRCALPDHIAARVFQIRNEGGAIIDIGACSTRPGAALVDEKEETERLVSAMSIIRTRFSDAVVSIDTFRSSVVQTIVELFGEVIINDVSGGEADSRMFETAGRLGLPYILMHSRGTPQTMQSLTHYTNLMGDIMLWFSEKLENLYANGVCDVILDPGFGFAKTAEQNFAILHRLDELNAFGVPVLVGMSRKSMVYRTINSTPEGALTGTGVVNMLALQRGASILRVHDVRDAVDVVRLWQAVSAAAS